MYKDNPNPYKEDGKNNILIEEWKKCRIPRKKKKSCFRPYLPVIVNYRNLCMTNVLKPWNSKQYKIFPMLQCNMVWSNIDISKRPGKLTDEGSPVSPAQCSCTQFCGCNGCCAWLWLWTGLLTWLQLTIFWSPAWINERKKHLAGKQCRTDNDVMSAVEDFFEAQDESFYTTGIQALQHRCVDRRGNYVEI